MKKDELVADVAKKTGLTQKEVNAVIGATVTTIVEACRDNGDSVNLPGLGIFKQKANPERMGRNPLTGEAIPVKASRTLKFSASSALKVVVETPKGRRK